jgi:regulator of protease activity HflC (stomatin/prohibitin superfamily)
MNNLWKMTIGIVVAGILIFLAISSIYTVDSGNRAIVLEFGRAISVQDDGLKFKNPISQTVRIVSIRVQSAKIKSDGATRNMQAVSMDIALNWRFDPNKLIEVYSTTGLDVAETIILNRVQEAIKATVAKYTAEELLAQREAVRIEIANILLEQLAKFNIIVETSGVQIVNLSFSKEFDRAIEQKQVAEQNVLIAQNELAQQRIESEKQIVKAQAEAEAIRIQTEVISRMGGKEYLRLKEIEKWDGKLPTYMGGSGPVPFMQVGK